MVSISRISILINWTYICFINMLIHMKRTSLMLDENLLEELRTLAQQAQRTLKDQIQLTLREGLRNMPKENKKNFELKLPTTKGNLIPGIDISNRDQLFSIFDEKLK